MCRDDDVTIPETSLPCNGDLKNSFPTVLDISRSRNRAEEYSGKYSQALGNDLPSTHLGENS